MAIVDVYDALTHDRVYRPALPEAEVLTILRAGRGTHFDPELLDAFMSLLPEMRAIAEAVTGAEPQDAIPIRRHAGARRCRGELARHYDAAELRIGPHGQPKYRVLVVDDEIALRLLLVANSRGSTANAMAPKTVCKPWT